MAPVVALLLPAPRLRRSPPACPRTVRLRRFAPCRTVRPAKFQSQKQSQRQRTGVSAPHGLWSSLCSLLRHGCGAPRPLAHELSGFVASLLAGRFAQQSSKVKSRVKGSGTGVSAPHGLWSSLCSLLRHGCGAPRPLAHELSGFVASLLAGRFAQQIPSQAESKAADRSVRSTRALVVALLLATPRLRRSPPACPRTVRLRRFAPCRTVRPAKFQSQKQSQRQRTGVSAPHGLWSSLCSLLRHGCGAPRPLAHELSGFVASLFAGRFAQQSLNASLPWSPPAYAASPDSRYAYKTCGRRETRGPGRGSHHP